MRISVYLALLCFFVTQDFTSCAKSPTPVIFKTVELGDTLTLNCTYNCSSGFVHGHWHPASNTSGCPEMIRNGNFCTVALCLRIVSAEDLKKNYTCYTEDREHTQLLQNIEQIISLQVQRKILNLTVAPKTDTKNEDLREAGELTGTGIKVLATVTVTVAIVLAALAFYLCVNRNRPNWHGKVESDASWSCSPEPPNADLLPVKGTPSTQSERVTVRIPPPDNESETEVPYADIMITVRGVSTPELTQVSYLSTGKRWGDESRGQLQASRSADRLHVPQPREVSRKMSTNSEYAVITYA